MKGSLEFIDFTLCSLVAAVILRAKRLQRRRSKSCHADSQTGCGLTEISSFHFRTLQAHSKASQDCGALLGHLV
jgi:hypothetical protein